MRCTGRAGRCETRLSQLAGDDSELSKLTATLEQLHAAAEHVSQHTCSKMTRMRWKQKCNSRLLP